MLGKKMEEAINLQINREIYSAYLYMSMSIGAASLGCKGSAKWLMVQFHEEMVHAMKFIEYVADQNGTVDFGAIAGPSGQYPSLCALFEKVLLSWYVTEQVEEEKNAGEIVRTLTMIGDNKTALFMYDKDLGLRTVTVPTDFSLGVTAAMKGA